MNELQIFNNEEFGQVRTLMLDGEPWFVGKDVAKALGYGEGKSLNNAVANHVYEEDKGVTEMVTPGGKQKIIIINESGLYSLILSSKLPSAKRFKHWVTSEVLPALRKTGSYTLIPQRNLTKDDYIRAASMVSNCRNERLPYVLHFLQGAGFTIPELEDAKEQREKLDLLVIDKLMREKGMSLNALSEITNICKSSLSYYRRGMHKPTPERYAIIIEALS